jgi:hypothetical protein
MGDAMTGLVPLYDPEAVVAAVARAGGGATADEHAVIYGAAVARRATDPEGTVAVSTLQWAGQVLMALRQRRCPWCGGPLREHSVDLAPEGCFVACHADDRVLRADVWLPGPAAMSTGYVLASLAGWLALPLLTLGLLAWVMPLVAAIARRRRPWAVAAAVLLSLAVLGAALPDAAGGAFLLLAWLGGTGYGALQVQPWLRTRPLGPRPTTTRQGYPPG